MEIIFHSPFFEPAVGMQGFNVKKIEFVFMLELIKLYKLISNKVSFMFSKAL